MAWEKLEGQQFMNNRRLHSINPMEDKRFIQISFDSYEENINRIKDVTLIPNIIKLLEGYYKLVPQPGDKKYLDERILKYQTELKESIEKERAEKVNKREPKVKAEKVEKPKVEKPKVEKPRKKTISATLKRLVWNTNIGEDIGKTKCLCCKSTDITQMSFHCGHVVAEINGGELIVSNLKPICQNCNSSMGTKNMNDFMETFK
jgi:5-methylcytosine-specific restriction endonuclease McrA